MDAIIKKYKLIYDEPRDVLYISVGKPRKATSEMDAEEFVIRYTQRTHTLCGITIINLNEYWLKHKRKFSNHLKKYLKDLSAEEIFEVLKSA